MIQKDRAGGDQFEASAAMFALIEHKEHEDEAKEHDLPLVDKDAHGAARFYAGAFPNSKVTAVHEAPGDYPGGKKGDVPTVEFTVLGIPCIGLNGGPSRSRQRIRKKRTVTGTRSSAMAAPKASAAGARTAGAFPGRSPRAR